MISILKDIFYKISKNYNQHKSFNNNYIFYQSAFTLIEIIISIALISIIIPTILLSFSTFNQNKNTQHHKSQALLYLAEAEEAIRVIKQKDFNEFSQAGVYYPLINNGTFELIPGTETINGIYNRQILVQSVQRDSQNNIVTSNGTNDPSTKKITITVFYNISTNEYIENTFYITRYDKNDTLIYDTKSDFEGGQLNNVYISENDNGEVTLNLNIDESSYINNYTNSDDYNYDQDKIVVQNGYASLKPLNDDIYSTLNSSFDDDLNNYNFIIFGDQSLPKIKIDKTLGNPTNFAYIDYKKAYDTYSQSYLSQSFNITSQKETAKLNFDYKIFEYSPTPLNFRVLAYIDNHNNEPTNLVFDSGMILSTSDWNSVLDLDVSQYVSEIGTYYLKVGSIIEYPSNKIGPFAVGFDNVLLTHTMKPVYSDQSPSIEFNESIELTDIINYTSFSAEATLNGQDIYFQLSNDYGETWQYFDGSNWVETSNNSDYNTEQEVKDNIQDFNPQDENINVKAFLSSDGVNNILLDDLTISYKSGDNVSQGTYTSETYDFSRNVAINNVTFDSSNYQNSNVKLQIATNLDNDMFNFVGPDGTSETYFYNDITSLNLANTLTRYLKYKIYLQSEGSVNEPYVDKINFNYSK